jgi:protein phosphatase
MTKFAVGAATDVGQVRQVNQDNILRADDVFAVADGMGGHRGGEVASLVAVEALLASFTDRTTDALVEAVQKANEAIVDRAKEDPDLRGMGTTMCALARVFLDDGEEILTVVNVGDSRAYLLKSGDHELVQISEDHSLVQTLFRQGQLTQAEAAVHPQRNILTRALGIDQRVLPDSFDLLPVKGDRYLLCSDGLFNEVDEPRIADVLREHADPQAAAEVLVQLANEGGGRDNISVVVVDIIDDAGHDEQLEEQSDERRVVHVVHGPERIGQPAEEVSLGNGRRDAAAGADGRHAKVTAAGAAGGSTIAHGSGPLHLPLASSPRSQFTWRVGAFVLIFVLIFGVAAFAIQFVANNTYYVGLDNSEVVIFQGRPGGFLWYQPTIVRRTEINAADVPAAFQADVAKGHSEATVEDAAKYIDSLKDQITTTTTSTTAPAASQSTTTAPKGIAGQIPTEIGPSSSTIVIR